MELNFPQIEEKILKFWEKKRTFEKLRKKIKGKKRFSFLDGPITANNPMGVHHAWGRTYKDLFQRYKAMQGFDQRFQNGFDCQGLWVEVEVEKELGFKSKKDIEKYGIAPFVEKCRERVRKYSKVQTEQSIRLGQWQDWKNSYYTMSDENNYAIWGFLKKCWKEGLLLRGRDVVPWCPRCGTSLSQHEILTEEYQEIVHKAVFVRLPVIGRKKTYLLIWTTTPWTLPANVALGVNPELTYAEVQDNKKDFYILLKDKSDIIPEGEIIKEFPGKKLAGLQYQGMFDELPAVRKALGSYQHSVLSWKDVSGEEGTGIVHLAPGCGQEDFQLSKKFNLPLIDPLDEESRYKQGFLDLTGKLASEVRELIFEHLKKKGLLFKIEDYSHRYPTCWRCQTELLFRLVDEWYIAMEKLRLPLMNTAKKINWIPGWGLQRELDWLKNMQDWLISKKRYWGLALPIFECECGGFEVIGSKEELKKRAVKGWENFQGHSPHRPWVDKIKIKCSKCSQLASRIPDVGSPWLDAGIVPFSTTGYYKNRNYWKKWFPADLIAESFPGQFKNWFYAIIVMSQVLESTNPVKTIFGYASVRDEKGEEMHKSKGNAIWFDEAVAKVGAEPMRWYYARQNPENNLLFGFKALAEVRRQLITLQNCFVFFKSYVSKKEIPLSSRPPKSKNILDKWILSTLNNLIEKTTKCLDDYDVSRAALAIEKFFIDELSLWYIRRSRKRFHKENNKKDRKSAISTLYYVLLDVLKLTAPIMPFFSEQLYQNIRQRKMSVSVHLCDFPKADKRLVNNKLEEKMQKTREIVAQVLAQRAKAGIRVRQPLASLQIPNSKRRTPKEMLGLIKDEVNVKKITFGKTLKLETKITPDLKEEGACREITRHIQEMRKKAGLTPKDKITVCYFGEPALNKIIEKNKKIILRETFSNKFVFWGKGDRGLIQEKNAEIDKMRLWLGIRKRK